MQNEIFRCSIKKKKLPTPPRPATHSMRVDEVYADRVIRGKPSATIQTFREIHEKKGRGKWSPKQDAGIIEMRKQGASINEIADAFGCSYDAIRSRMRYLRRDGKL